MKIKIIRYSLVIVVIFLFLTVSIRPVISKTFINNENYLSNDKNRTELYGLEFYPIFAIINNLTEDIENGTCYFHAKFLIGFGFHYSTYTGFSLEADFVIDKDCWLNKNIFYGLLNDKYIVGFYYWKE